MTSGQKAAATAAANKAKREAKKQLERQERETIKAALLSVLSDKTATPADRIEAIKLLNSVEAKIL